MLISAFACAVTFGGPLARAETRDAFRPDRMDTVLYGVAYYPEYMPYDRLDQDVQLMQKAGITVVRIGESSWGLWEPQDGKFEFAWMDRVVDKLTRRESASLWARRPIRFPPGCTRSIPRSS